jgi:hypothetical protein
MAYREVTMLEVKEVLRLWLRGRAIRAIARSVGVTRNTVRSYVETAVACGLAVEAGEAALSEEKLGEVLLRLRLRPERGKGESWGRCESEREFIEGLLRQRVRLSKVRRLLERRGVLAEAGDQALKEAVRLQIQAALREAEALPPKPPVESLFEDVYAEPMRQQREQLESLRQAMRDDPRIANPRHGDG